MEIEDLLKDAADWRPKTEMPEGLEQRALASRVRPPLRPMGIARPRTVLLATAMAGAACMLLMVRLPHEAPTPVQPKPTQLSLPQKVAKSKPDALPKATKLESPVVPRKHHPRPRITRRPPLRELPPKRQKESPLTRPFAVAVDSPRDSVMVGSRVAVDPPVYTPAYYAEPSADGQEITYTPVAVPMDDPTTTSTTSTAID